MVFSSIYFLAYFLPIVLILYYILPARLKNGWLFLASLFFYGWGEPVYILIMLFSTVFDYTNGRLIERFDRQGKHNTASRAVLVMSLVVNLGILCFFKYTDFLIDNINSAFNMGIQAPNLALPIGISFYTFQTLSYTIDVYRGKVDIQHNVISFGMYVALFPQLIAGPIVRYADVAAEVDNRQHSFAQTSAGLQRFLIGLGKKVILANQAGEAFDSLKTYSGGDASCAVYWLTAIMFTFQIYFDFSGYSDMAIGLGQMLGFHFPENFDHPYESKSITEFWRRWHMTLGTWFREYLYIPLGGNRCSVGRHIFNLLVVWFLTGLWHGAGWNFIFWGLYYFLLLVLEKYFLGKVLNKLPGWVSHVYTMLLVVLGWVIFAFDDVSQLGIHFAGLFDFGHVGNSLALYEWGQYLPFLIVLVIGCTSLPARICKKIFASRESENELSSVGRILKAVYTLALLIISVVLLSAGSYNPFLYFRF